MKKQQSGFTLIELIMVIVILGILSAFALPRFADLGTDARKAVIQGAAGSIKSASAIAHSKYLAEGTNPATVTLEGVPIDLANGYPTAHADGIIAAAQVAGDFDVSGAGPILVQAKGATTPANCQVSYTAAGAGGTPTITVTDTGC